MVVFSTRRAGLFGAPASETKSAGHAYQLCKPTNDRTDRTGETRIKCGLSEPQKSVIPVLFSLYVNDMPSPSHHVELTLYADYTAFIASSRKTTLFVTYLESYLNDL
jgi:hypothetical protein